MSYGKSDELYGYQTLYREMGYYITRKEQYERALKYFNEAISKTPKDKRALMGRSWARAKACQYQGALDDINKALEEDSGDLVVLAQKALNTYLSCEFEEALIQNTRLVPVRNKPDNFVMGVMHCTEGIENCVGARAGRPLRDHFKIIRKLAWKKSFEDQKPYVPKSKYKKKKKKKKKKKAKEKKSVREPVAPMKTKKASKNTGTDVPYVVKLDPNLPEEIKPENIDTVSLAVSIATVGTTYVPIDPELEIRDSLYTHASEENIIPPYPKPFPYRPLQRYTSNIENYMSEKYLDSMYLDKIFLKNLRFVSGIKCPNKSGSKKILQLSKFGYKTLSYNQELLRTRRPFYFLKYQEAISTGALRARQMAELLKLQTYAKKDADTLIGAIEYYISKKQSRFALENAEKLKIYCDSKPKKILPYREMYLHRMYDLVCEAHFIMKRLNKNQFEWDQEKRIYNTLGVPLSREPSSDSVINQFKGVFVDWNKQITVYEERLRKAITPHEMAWLYHELSRFHSELKQYELSRVYARKCITEGRRCDNIAWVINAHMLITKVNMLQHNKNDAKVELHEAMEVAKMMGDEELLEYLQKCLQVVDKVEFENVYGPKVLEKREKKIIEMMSSSNMKDEAAYLFRKMAVMPAARRMSVMPGVRLEDAQDKPISTKKMSIMPEAKTTDDDLIKTHGKAKTQAAVTSEAGKGVGFMELIQYHVD